MAVGATSGPSGVRAGATACRGVLLAAAALPSAYLAIVSAVGLARSRRAGRPPVDAAGARLRFAVLVPAHDEAAGIGETLTSLRALRHERFEIHVVADNCTDATADVVRSFDVAVHERTDPEHPGKGPALNWLFDRLDGRGFDVFVVVDADTSVDPGFLRAVEEAIVAGAEVVQGRYSVRRPEASPATSFRYAALACRHHLRPLGRRGLGGSCGLYGNGMAFRREILAERRWTDHLVEDAELQLELLLDGHLVEYAPDAIVLAEMPVDRDQATSQQQRWEAGRLDLVRRFAGRLLRRAITGPSRRASADALLDLLVPPLSVLVVAEAALAAAAAPFALTGGRGARRMTTTGVLGVAIVAGHAVAGLATVGADRHHYRALASAPATVLWKTRLWLSLATGRAAATWQRTTRNSEAGT